ncbi:MAG: flagellar FliJ family protein [Pyrinomonadaceae bacterium]|nr:flagellar FliJ family protein [Phycisphaerales bacterium]
MAKKFVFNMQLVLQQRIRAEEQRQLIVAEFEKQRLEVESRIRGFQQGIYAAKQDLRDRLNAQQDPAVPHPGDGSGRHGISLGEVRMQANASLQLVVRAQQAVLELAGVHQRLDSARLELLKAAADRKAVELLRARRFQEWKDQQQRFENAELDEMTVMRHARRDQDVSEEAA